SAVAVLVGASALAVLVGLGVAFFLSRSIATAARAVQTTLTSLTDRCATDLSAGLDGMARNDLTFKVTPVTPRLPDFGSDEIGETARVTNRLRDTIVAMVGSYENARAGLQGTIQQVQSAAVGVTE